MKKKWNVFTFDCGTEQSVADIGPAEVHPDHGERDGEEAGGNGAKGAEEAVGLGVEDGSRADGGHGEANEEGEGDADEGEAGAVVPKVCSGPGEREGGGEGLILVHRLLLQRHGALRLRRTPVPEGRRGAGGDGRETRLGTTPLSPLSRVSVRVSGQRGEFGVSEGAEEDG